MHNFASIKISQAPVQQVHSSEAKSSDHHLLRRASRQDQQETPIPGPLQAGEHVQAVAQGPYKELQGTAAACRYLGAKSQQSDEAMAPHIAVCIEGKALTLSQNPTLFLRTHQTDAFLESPCLLFPITTTRCACGCQLAKHAPCLCSTQLSGLTQAS